MEFSYPFENIFQSKATLQNNVDGIFKCIVLENGRFPTVKPCDIDGAIQNKIRADFNTAFEK